MARRWSLPNYFPSNTQSILRRCFFLAAGNEKFQRPNRTAIAYDANEYPPDDWLKTGWARDSQNTHTARGFSDLYHAFVRSLSTNVFERRTSTGSEVFSLLICFDTTKFVLLRVSTIIETVCPKVCSKSQLKSAKSLLPVDMRRSKTSLLKLANAFSVLHYVINVALHSHLGY